MTREEEYEELERKKERARQGGGSDRIRRQHEKGKLTARERLDLLLDDGSFVETGTLVESRVEEFGMEEKQYPGDGVVTGYGEVDGTPVYVYSQDFTVMGGSLGEMHAKKIERTIESALQTGVPLIGLNDSGGARIQEGAISLAGYGEIFRLNVKASGVIPQISAILGPCAGGAVYSPSLTDFIFMVEGVSKMFITGPDVVKEVTGEEITYEELGGTRVHGEQSGVAHFVYQNEERCIRKIRELLSYLPLNNLDGPPRVQTQDPVDRKEEELLEVVPEDPNKPYDVKRIIEMVLDEGSFLEVQEKWARNILVGFGRLDGLTVGVVANQPKFLAGSLDIDSSSKGARFVRFCDSFNIPLVTFVDIPGFLPGVDQEHGGIIRHGAKLLYAFSEATVPRVSVITRKAYGGGYDVMNSKHVGADYSFAWPTAEIAVMGPEGAVNIVHRREIRDAEDPEAKREELVREYRERFANPYVAAEMGFLDDVIKPDETRPVLIRSLRSVLTKREDLPKKKHGNVPL